MTAGSPKASEPVTAQFAGIELDLSSSELIRQGQRTRLQRQPFLVLRVLLEHAGEVVTREELKGRLWPGETFVDFEHGLNKSVAKLRDALGRVPGGVGLIETLPTRGYRLCAEVCWIRPKLADVTAANENTPAPPRASVKAISLLAFGGMLVLALTTRFEWRTLAGLFTGRSLIRSLAVMPLINLSKDSEQDYFAAGMTEELATDLSYARSLRVVSGASTVRVGGSRLSVPDIADRLQVDAVIQGTVLHDHGRVRVTIRLTKARPERQIWAASYEGEQNSAISLQDRIALEAVAQIRTKLTPEEPTRTSLESHNNPEAYHEYLRGRYFLEQEIAQGEKAIPHLERAVQLDPNFASAYAALGEAWAIQGVWGKQDNQQTSAKALSYSQKAVSLDPTSSEAYSSLGHSLMQSRRWNDGEAALQRSIRLDPTNLYAKDYLSLLLVQKGSVAKALELSRELADTNPVALHFQHTYAEMLYRSHHYDEAIAQCRRILELDPNHLAAYTTLANALVETGRYHEAESAFTTGGFMDPGVRAWLMVREGKASLARQILHENPSLLNVHTAVALYLLGERDAGLAELDKLANVKWAVKTYHLRNDPTFDPMRNDPAFDAIVKGTGLMDR